MLLANVALFDGEGFYEADVFVKSEDDILKTLVDTSYSEAYPLKDGAEFAHLPRALNPFRAEWGALFDLNDEEVELPEWMECHKVEPLLKWEIHEGDDESVAFREEQDRVREEVISSKYAEVGKPSQAYLEEFLSKIGKKFNSVELDFNDSDERVISYSEALEYTLQSAEKDSATKFWTIHGPEIKVLIKQRIPNNPYV